MPVNASRAEGGDCRTADSRELLLTGMALGVATLASFVSVVTAATHGANLFADDAWYYAIIAHNFASSGRPTV